MASVPTLLRCRQSGGSLRCSNAAGRCATQLSGLAATALGAPRGPSRERSTHLYVVPMLRDDLRDLRQQSGAVRALHQQHRDARLLEHRVAVVLLRPRRCRRHATDARRWPQNVDTEHDVSRKTGRIGTKRGRMSAARLKGWRATSPDATCQQPALPEASSGPHDCAEV
jgi:hypothetical protein